VTVRKLFIYFSVLALALLLLTRGPAPVKEITGTPGRVTLTGGPMVQRGNTDGLTSMVIAWRTREESNSQVDYGETSDYGQRAVTYDVTDRHAVVLRHLKPDTQYHYRVLSDNNVLARAVFQTGKTADRPFKFAVLGDSGSGTTRQYLVAQQVENQAVDLVIHTGDVVYPSGKDKDYPARFYLPYKNLLARIALLPAIGNHDLETANGQAWLDNFVLPGQERFYSFSYGNALFVALDSYRSNRESARWLEAQLAGTDKLWKFVYFHEPPFSNHKNRSGHADARGLWVPLFSRYRVDVVFSGHDHMYTRFQPRDGIHYIVEGLGGNSFQKIKPQAKEVLVTNNTEFGFGLVEIVGRKLVFKHITASGDVLDTFSLRK
jgi:predicted phosphodiesterase